MSTFMATAEHAKAGRWHVIDAEGQVLGRIATRAARLTSASKRWTGGTDGSGIRAPPPDVLAGVARTGHAPKLR